MPAYRAYISYNSHEGAKPLSIVFDGETTGIYARQTTRQTCGRRCGV
ncbi:hypothetical protein [Prevotella intermedia]|nr:hypothetical protein [Prevotella intermedia]